MRPIKFRVFNKEDNKYESLEPMVGELCIDREGNLCFPSGGDFGSGYLFKLEKEKYVLEQFTGLHDKNGKEIYINDILQKSRHYQRMVSKEESEEIIENEILFVRESHELGFYICNKSGININNNTKNNFDHRFGGAPNYEEKIYLEVIGNIHENGDLLC